MGIEKKLGKVLVIDDNEGIRKVLQEFLTQEGYAVFVADKGKKGIELAKKEQPDLIYLDIVMKNTDNRFRSGYNILEDLMKCEETKEIYVIVMSGLVEEQIAEELSSASGAAEYIKKPFDLEKTIKPLTKMYVDESQARKKQNK